MIHYHGTPITPDLAAAAALSGGHAFVSYARPDQIAIAFEVCQSFAVDNGAFSAWRSGNPITDWRPFYEWVREVRKHPAFDWAVIPDVIDGDEKANDDLLAQWPFPKWVGAPVWHMHESIGRLQRLCASWPRICLGSSGEYSRVGTTEWWARMGEAMAGICDGDGLPFAKLHGLRMLNPKVFERLPLSSADSTNIGRNVGIDLKWKGTYTPHSKPMRASVMRGRIESINGASRWMPIVREIDTSWKGGDTHVATI